MPESGGSGGDPLGGSPDCWNRKTATVTPYEKEMALMYQHAMRWQKGVQITYYRANAWGYYHVTLQVLDQEIAVHEKVLKQVLGTDSRVYLGCCEITIEECVELGFVFPTQSYRK
jgi:hypothetical protein